MFAITRRQMKDAQIRYKLKNWRRQHDLSQAAAAARVGVARRTWHKWEHGAMVPGPARMAALLELTCGALEPNDFYPSAKTEAA